MLNRRVLQHLAYSRLFTETLMTFIIVKVRIQVYEHKLLVCVCELDLVSLRHYGVVGTVYLVHITQESSLQLSEGPHGSPTVHSAATWYMRAPLVLCWCPGIAWGSLSRHTYMVQPLRLWQGTLPAVPHNLLTLWIGSPNLAVTFCEILHPGVEEKQGLAEPHTCTSQLNRCCVASLQQWDLLSSLVPDPVCRLLFYLPHLRLWKRLNPKPFHSLGLTRIS